MFSFQMLNTCVYLGFEADPSSNVAARIRGPNVSLLSFSYYPLLFLIYIKRTESLVRYKIAQHLSLFYNLKLYKRISRSACLLL